MWFWYCFVCGLRLWNWRARVWCHNHSFCQAFPGPMPAGPKGPVKSRCSSQISQLWPVPESKASKDLQYLLLLSVRRKLSCIYFMREGLPTSLSLFQRDSWRAGKMKILLFYLFWAQGTLLENRWYWNAVLIKAAVCHPVVQWDIGKDESDSTLTQ